MTDNTEKQTADTTAAETVKTEESTPTDAPENAEQPEKKVEIIGVRFKQGCKTYYFAAGKNVAKVGDSVIVDTARGLELVSVALANKLVSEKEIVPPLRPVIRVATQNDLRRAEENHRKESEAYEICKKKIAEHKLDMSLVGAEYTFDNAKLLFYFTSDGRVDFRDLVKDLASVFCTALSCARSASAMKPSCAAVSASAADLSAAAHFCPTLRRSPSRWQRNRTSRSTLPRSPAHAVD